MAASKIGKRQLAFALRANAQLERAMRRKIRAELNKRIRAAAKGYRSDGMIGSENALRGHEDIVEAIIREQYVRTAQLYGPRILDSLKGDGAWAQKDFADDLFNRLIAEWLASPSTDRIGRDIARTTRTQIRQIISAGIADGFGTDKIARLIRSKLGGLNASLRAHVVARTEIHNAASFATDAAARSAGIPGLEKEWVAVEDTRTRLAHAETDGEKVGMDDPFSFTRKNGDTYVLMHPGDPNGPPAGTINCRCVLAYHPPSP